MFVGLFPEKSAARASVLRCRRVPCLFPAREPGARWSVAAPASAPGGRIGRVSDLAAVTTARLRLTRPAPADLPELHALHADARGYRHLPSARHATVARTEALLAGYARSWERHGLGPWVVRAAADGRLVGMGGCGVRGDVGWNLYYRLVPEEQGRGYAQEVIAAARAAAVQARPDLPVVAYLLEHNAGSRRAAERAGLTLVWRGPDAGNPDPAAVRLVYADRAASAAALAEFTGEGQARDSATTTS